MTDPNALASYRRAVARRGRTVTFRRIEGQAPNAAIFDATVSAIVEDYVPQGEVLPVKREGGVTQGARRITVIDADLTAKRFPLPLRKNDRAIVDGNSLNIAWVDPEKRAVAGASEMIAVGT